MEDYPALEALLEGRIDHSGVFPPTALKFEDALAKSTRFDDELARPYMIGCEMVIPQAALEDLRRGLPASFRSRLYRAAVIANDPFPGPACEIALSQCLEFNRASQSAAPAAGVASLEFKASATDPSGAAAAFESLARLAASGGKRPIMIFLEPDLSTKDFEQTANLYIRVLSASHSKGVTNAGFKARTSGETGLTRDRLSRIIALVSEAQLPFKVTGGLHYPLPAEGREHGFLSVSAAVALTRRFNLRPARILEILGSTNAAQFEFTDKLRWSDLEMNSREVSAAMRAQHFSIGCCNPSLQDAELSKLLGRIE